MGGLHEPDSSQRSQLHHSPMSWYTIAPRASEAMALTLARNGVRWPPPNNAVNYTLYSTGYG
eukprot:793447-Prymnesium_polylepis.1